MFEAVFQNPSEFRIKVREGGWRNPTPYQCPGYVQANLVVLPKEYAFDFMGFCHRNPKPCPLIEVLEPGETEAKISAPRSDIRTDLPKYRVFQKGKTYLRDDVKDLWRDDLVTFLLGCSFTFDSVLLNAGIPVRHIGEGKNVSMYITNRRCNPFGVFRGPLIVSMRPIPSHLIPLAVELSGDFPIAHGSPVHVGNPLSLGIKDLKKPDFGDPVTIEGDEIPVFWACG
ncbi:MAG: putative hydro-lyase, partial [Desulfatiglandales bacterium]